MITKEAKFSLWCDFVERDFLEKEFPIMIEKKIVNGATSNPSIFKNAFLNSPAYKEDISALKNKKAKEVYETLAIKDIKITADILKELYLKGDDGFISLEVDPFLSDDAKATITEAKRLHSVINAENVMIKIPATEAGFEAMEVLFSEGINVNATLIFSPAQAEGCLDAFAKGLEIFQEKGLEKKAPQAVISIFVSRFDRKLNGQLAQKSLATNRLGILNATRIYHDIRDRDIKGVRTLFASTGVKGDDLVKDHYITELLFEDCVNTAPIETINAFLDNNNKEVKNPASKDEIEIFFKMLKENDIDIQKVYSELMQEGLESFNDAFKEILEELS